jgi:hypothetical protein
MRGNFEHLRKDQVSALGSLVTDFVGDMGHLEKLISVPIADPSGVNVCESEREQNRIVRGNFVVPDWGELFFGVPCSDSAALLQFPERLTRW